VFGVPFRGVLALWVGFADLIPLVGATLGAIPTIGVAFLHSTAAGVGIVIFYIVYQQFENHVLQVQIMSKTVDINQLFVLVSVLAGVELFGVLGALLAIPAAGVMQVIIRDLWDHRTGRMKDDATIGEDRTPVAEVLAEREADQADERDREADERDVAAAELAEREPDDHDHQRGDDEHQHGDGEPEPADGAAEPARPSAEDQPMHVPE
jgi:hypothetical protein